MFRRQGSGLQSIEEENVDAGGVYLSEWYADADASGEYSNTDVERQLCTRTVSGLVK